jgi:hypothetical protein
MSSLLLRIGNILIVGRDYIRFLSKSKAKIPLIGTCEKNSYPQNVENYFK